MFILVVSTARTRPEPTKACGQKEWYLKDGEEMPDKEHPVSALIILIYLTLF